MYSKSLTVLLALLGVSCSSLVANATETLSDVSALTSSVISEQKAAATESSSPDVVCFGDSITNRGYYQALAELVGIKTHNSGIGGNTSRQGLRRIQKDLLDHSPKLAVILFGTNDIRIDSHKYVGIEEYESNLQAMVEACTSKAIKVLFCTPPPINSEAYFDRHNKADFDKLGGLEKLLSDYSNVVRKVANQNECELVDLNQLLVNKPQWMSKDGVHPTPQGNKIIAELVANKVKIHVSSNEPHEEVISNAERMQWWTDAKFGMFIHWGVYSKAGGEWNGETNHAEWLQLTAKIPLAEYTEFAKTFNPSEFDANTWVRVAKNAGMKYLVITSKHHDGVAMYDSASSDHNVMDLAGLKVDPIRALAEACREQGLRFGVYYSLGRDWEDPEVPTGKYQPGWRSNLLDFPDEKNKDFSIYFERKVKPQVTELLSNYGPLDILWFDTPELIKPAQSKELLELVRSIQPRCIVNQRVGNDLGDYGTPEQTIPAEVDTEPWETCMTLNQHWGYNRADQEWKSSASLVRNLIDITSKGGNYLLNVGPTGKGIIPEPSVERLNDMGEWLSLYGEAIYGCGPTPFGEELGAYSETEKDKKGKPKFIASKKWRATTKPGKLYLHLFQWPEQDFEAPVASERVVQAYLLTPDGKVDLKIASSNLGTLISLPKDSSNDIASVICLELAP